MDSSPQASEGWLICAVIVVMVGCSDDG